MDYNKRNRVLHIIWGTSIGGAERALFQLIKGQREYSYISDLLVISASSHYSQEIQKCGAKVYALRKNQLSYIKKILFFFEIIRKYDLLHFHGTLPFDQLLTWLEGGRKILYTHRAGVHHYPLKRKISYKIFGFLLKKTNAKISGNTKCAALAASNLFNMPIEEISVTYNGLDFSLLHPKKSKNEVLNELKSSNNDVIRVGTTANIRKWKRINYLLYSIKEVNNENIHCVIIGDGPEGRRLRAAADQRQSTRRVRAHRGRRR